MRFLLIAFIAVTLLNSSFKEESTSKEILFAEGTKNINSAIQYYLRLRTDSIFILNFTKKEWGSNEVSEISSGRYFIHFDTINFDPIQIPYINSDKAIIREGFVEFLNGKRPMRLKITRTTLPLIERIDTARFKDYVFFSFNPKHYDCFSDNVKPVFLDNTEVTTLDSLLTAGLRNSKSRALKASEYFKQCVAVIDSNGNKIVWINLNCADMDYKFGIDYVHDGGECFANVKIDLARKKFYDLWVNGYEGE
jgi:hypothetical protein